MKESSPEGKGRVLIISAFPATGKTTLSEKYSQGSTGNPAGNKVRVLDLESSDYRWVEATANTSKEDRESFKGRSNRTERENWLKSYTDAIESSYREALQEEGVNTLILVAQFKELIEDLTLNRNLPIVFVQPKDSPENKAEYLRRVRARGNQEAFAVMLEKNFSDWIRANSENYRNNSLVTIETLEAPDSYLGNLEFLKKFLQ